LHAIRDGHRFYGDQLGRRVRGTGIEDVLAAQQGRNRDHQARTVDHGHVFNVLRGSFQVEAKTPPSRQAEVTIAPWLELSHLGHDTPLGTNPGPLCGIDGQDRRDPGVEQLELFRISS
jgi:hypothetical protein